MPQVDDSGEILVTDEETGELVTESELRMRRALRQESRAQPPVPFDSPGITGGEGEVYRPPAPVQAPVRQADVQAAPVRPTVVDDRPYGFTQPEEGPRWSQGPWKSDDFQTPVEPFPEPEPVTGIAEPEPAGILPPETTPDGRPQGFIEPEGILEPETTPAEQRQVDDGIEGPPEQPMQALSPQFLEQNLAEQQSLDAAQQAELIQLDQRKAEAVELGKQQANQILADPLSQPSRSLPRDRLVIVPGLGIPLYVSGTDQAEDLAALDEAAQKGIGHLGLGALEDLARQNLGQITQAQDQLSRSQTVWDELNNQLTGMAPGGKVRITTADGQVHEVGQDLIAFLGQAPKLLGPGDKLTDSEKALAEFYRQQLDYGTYLKDKQAEVLKAQADISAQQALERNIDIAKQQDLAMVVPGQDPYLALRRSIEDGTIKEIPVRDAAEGLRVSQALGLGVAAELTREERGQRLLTETINLIRTHGDLPQLAAMRSVIETTYGLDPTLTQAALQPLQTPPAGIGTPVADDPVVELMAQRNLVTSQQMTVMIEKAALVQMTDVVSDFLHMFPEETGRTNQEIINAIAQGGKAAVASEEQALIQQQRTQAGITEADPGIQLGDKVGQFLATQGDLSPEVQRLVQGQDSLPWLLQKAGQGLQAVGNVLGPVIDNPISLAVLKLHPAGALVTAGEPILDGLQVTGELTQALVSTTFMMAAPLVTQMALTGPALSMQGVQAPTDTVLNRAGEEWRQAMAGRDPLDAITIQKGMGTTMLYHALKGDEEWQTIRLGVEAGLPAEALVRTHMNPWLEFVGQALPSLWFDPLVIGWRIASIPLDSMHLMRQLGAAQALVKYTPEGRILARQTAGETTRLAAYEGRYGRLLDRVVEANPLIKGEADPLARRALALTELTQNQGKYLDDPSLSNWLRRWVFDTPFSRGRPEANVTSIPAKQLEEWAYLGQRYGDALEPAAKLGALAQTHRGRGSRLFGKLAVEAGSERLRPVQADTIRDMRQYFTDGPLYVGARKSANAARLQASQIADKTLGVVGTLLNQAEITLATSKRFLQLDQIPYMLTEATELYEEGFRLRTLQGAALQDAIRDWGVRYGFLASSSEKVTPDLIDHVQALGQSRLDENGLEIIRHLGEGRYRAQQEVMAALYDGIGRGLVESVDAAKIRLPFGVNLPNPLHGADVLTGGQAVGLRFAGRIPDQAKAATAEARQLKEAGTYDAGIPLRSATDARVRELARRAGVDGWEDLSLPRDTLLARMEGRAALARWKPIASISPAWTKDADTGARKLRYDRLSPPEQLQNLITSALSFGFLNTPRFVIRNVLNNRFTMALDGWNPLGGGTGLMHGPIQTLSKRGMEQQLRDLGLSDLLVGGGGGTIMGHTQLLTGMQKLAEHPWFADQLISGQSPAYIRKPGAFLAGVGKTIVNPARWASALEQGDRLRIIGQSYPELYRVLSEPTTGSFWSGVQQAGIRLETPLRTRVEQALSSTDPRALDQLVSDLRMGRLPQVLADDALSPTTALVASAMARDALNTALQGVQSYAEAIGPVRTVVSKIASLTGDSLRQMGVTAPEAREALTVAFDEAVYQAVSRGMSREIAVRQTSRELGEVLNRASADQAVLKQVQAWVDMASRPDSLFSWGASRSMASEIHDLLRGGESGLYQKVGDVIRRQVGDGHEPEIARVLDRLVALGEEPNARPLIQGALMREFHGVQAPPAAVDHVPARLVINGQPVPAPTINGPIPTNGLIHLHPDHVPGTRGPIQGLIKDMTPQDQAAVRLGQPLQDLDHPATKEYLRRKSLLGLPAAAPAAALSTEEGEESPLGGIIPREVLMMAAGLGAAVSLKDTDAIRLLVHQLREHGTELASSQLVKAARDSGLWTKLEAGTLSLQEFLQGMRRLDLSDTVNAALDQTLRGAKLTDLPPSLLDDGQGGLVFASGGDAARMLQQEGVSRSGIRPLLIEAERALQMGEPQVSAADLGLPAVVQKVLSSSPFNLVDPSTGMAEVGPILALGNILNDVVLTRATGPIGEVKPWAARSMARKALYEAHNLTPDEQSYLSYVGVLDDDGQPDVIGVRALIDWVTDTLGDSNEINRTRVPVITGQLDPGEITARGTPAWTPTGRQAQVLDPSISKDREVLTQLRKQDEAIFREVQEGLEKPDVELLAWEELLPENLRDLRQAQPRTTTDADLLRNPDWPGTQTVPGLETERILPEFTSSPEAGYPAGLGRFAPGIKGPTDLRGTTPLQAQQGGRVAEVSVRDPFGDPITKPNWDQVYDQILDTARQRLGPDTVNAWDNRLQRLLDEGYEKKAILQGEGRPDKANRDAYDQWLTEKLGRPVDTNSLEYGQEGGSGYNRLNAQNKLAMELIPEKKRPTRQDNVFEVQAAVKALLPDAKRFIDQQATAAKETAELSTGREAAFEGKKDLEDLWREALERMVRKVPGLLQSPEEQELAHWLFEYQGARNVLAKAAAAEGGAGGPVYEEARALFDEASQELNRLAYPKGRSDINDLFTGGYMRPDAPPRIVLKPGANARELMQWAATTAKNASAQGPRGIRIEEEVWSALKAAAQTRLAGVEEKHALRLLGTVPGSMQAVSEGRVLPPGSYDLLADMPPSAEMEELKRAIDQADRGLASVDRRMKATMVRDTRLQPEQISVEPYQSLSEPERIALARGRTPQAGSVTDQITQVVKQITNESRARRQLNEARERLGTSIDQVHEDLIRLYHGRMAPEGLTQFNPKGAERSWAGPGLTYFSDRSVVAEDYAIGMFPEESFGSQILPMDLAGDTRILDLSPHMQGDQWTPGDLKPLVQQAKTEGYLGVKYPSIQMDTNTDAGAMTYALFDEGLEQLRFAYTGEPATGQWTEGKTLRELSDTAAHLNGSRPAETVENVRDLVTDGAQLGAYEQMAAVYKQLDQGLAQLRTNQANEFGQLVESLVRPQTAPGARSAKGPARMEPSRPRKDQEQRIQDAMGQPRPQEGATQAGIPEPVPASVAQPSVTFGRDPLKTTTQVLPGSTTPDALPEQIGTMTPFGGEGDTGIPMAGGGSGQPPTPPPTSQMATPLEPGGFGPAISRDQWLATRNSASPQEAEKARAPLQDGSVAQRQALIDQAREALGVTPLTPTLTQQVLGATPWAGDFSHPTGPGTQVAQLLTDRYHAESVARGLRQNQLPITDQELAGMGGPPDVSQRPGLGLNEPDRDKLINLLEDHRVKSTHDHITALMAAKRHGDYALHNYAQRNDLDTLLRMVIPWHFWTTRSVVKYGERLLERPWAFGGVARFSALYDGLSGADGEPLPDKLKERLKEKILPFTPGWAEGVIDRVPGMSGVKLGTDPRRMFFPMDMLGFGDSPLTQGSGKQDDLYSTPRNQLTGFGQFVAGIQQLTGALTPLINYTVQDKWQSLLYTESWREYLSARNKETTSLPPALQQWNRLGLAYIRGKGIEIGPIPLTQTSSRDFRTAEWVLTRWMYEGKLDPEQTAREMDKLQKAWNGQSLFGGRLGVWGEVEVDGWAEQALREAQKVNFTNSDGFGAWTGVPLTAVLPGEIMQAQLGGKLPSDDLNRLLYGQYGSQSGDHFKYQIGEIIIDQKDGKPITRKLSPDQLVDLVKRQALTEGKKAPGKAGQLYQTAKGLEQKLKGQEASLTDDEWDKYLVGAVVGKSDKQGLLEHFSTGDYLKEISAARQKALTGPIAGKNQLFDEDAVARSQLIQSWTEQRPAKEAELRQQSFDRWGVWPQAGFGIDSLEEYYVSLVREATKAEHFRDQDGVISWDTRTAVKKNIMALVPALTREEVQRLLDQNASVEEVARDVVMDLYGPAFQALKETSRMASGKERDAAVKAVQEQTRVTEDAVYDEIKKRRPAWDDAFIRYHLTNTEAREPNAEASVIEAMRQGEDMSQVLPGTPRVLKDLFEVLDDEEDGKLLSGVTDRLRLPNGMVVDSGKPWTDSNGKEHKPQGNVDEYIEAKGTRDKLKGLDQGAYVRHRETDPAFVLYEKYFGSGPVAAELLRQIQEIQPLIDQGLKVGTERAAVGERNEPKAAYNDRLARENDAIRAENDRRRATPGYEPFLPYHRSEEFLKFETGPLYPKDYTETKKRWDLLKEQYDAIKHPEEYLATAMEMQSGRSKLPGLADGRVPGPQIDATPGGYVLGDHRTNQKALAELGTQVNQQWSMNIHAEYKGEQPTGKYVGTPLRKDPYKEEGTAAVSTTSSKGPEPRPASSQRRETSQRSSSRTGGARDPESAIKGLLATAREDDFLDNFPAVGEYVQSIYGGRVPESVQARLQDAQGKWPTAENTPDADVRRIKQKDLLRAIAGAEGGSAGAGPDSYPRGRYIVTDSHGIEKAIPYKMNDEPGEAVKGLLANARQKELRDNWAAVEDYVASLYGFFLPDELKADQDVRALRMDRFRQTWPEITALLDLARASWPDSRTTDTALRWGLQGQSIRKLVDDLRMKEGKNKLSEAKAPQTGPLYPPDVDSMPGRLSKSALERNPSMSYVRDSVMSVMGFPNLANTQRNSTLPEGDREYLAAESWALFRAAHPDLAKVVKAAEEIIKAGTGTLDEVALSLINVVLAKQGKPPLMALYGAGGQARQTYRNGQGGYQVGAGPSTGRELAEDLGRGRVNIRRRDPLDEVERINRIRPNDPVRVPYLGTSRRRQPFVPFD